MRPILSCVLTACVTVTALCIPRHLEAQDVAQLERDCAAGKAEACVELGDQHLGDLPWSEADWRRAAATDAGS